MQSQRIVELDDRSRRQLAHTRPETQVALSVVTVSDDYLHWSLCFGFGRDARRPPQ